MPAAPACSPAWPFFLPAAEGTGARFCIYHAPRSGAGAGQVVSIAAGAAEIAASLNADIVPAITPATFVAVDSSSSDSASIHGEVPCRGALVMVHAFAEEMNRSRRMFAMQARALADAGFAVLLMDLYGCGDSSGDFGQARWDIWLADLVLARQWLALRTGMPVGFLGLRLGASLALQAAVQDPQPAGMVGPLILWQPVPRGDTYLTQFLRLQQAAYLLSTAGTEVALPGSAPAGEGEQATTLASARPDGEGSAALRKRLLAGQCVEVSGYLLAPALAASIDALNMATVAIPHNPIYWLDIAVDESTPIAAARQRSIESLERAGARLRFRQVRGPAFWASQEIAEAPALLAATLELLGNAP